jgi:hypothetical protein
LINETENEEELHT